MFSPWMRRPPWVLLVVALGLAACAGPASTSSAPTSSLVANNTVQGSITVYGALTDANGTALSTAFQQTYPQVTVNVITGGTGPLVTRIESERRAGGVNADVILLADPTVMPSLQQEGVLSPYTPAEVAGLASDLKGYGWAGAFTFNNVIVARTDGPSPQDWSDLTNPQYNGRVMLGDPSYSGTTLGMVGYLSQSLGWSYFKQLQQNGARVVQSTNTVGTDVAQGSVQGGITLDSVVRLLVPQGSPVKIVWPTSGAIPVPAPASVVSGHESVPTEAFMDWLFTPDGQKALVQLGYAPVIGQSDAVPGNAKLVSVDWSQIAAQRDQILQQFQSIFS